MRILRLRAYYDPEQTAGIHMDHDLCEAFSSNKIFYISYTPMPTRGITDKVRNEYKNKKKEIKNNGYVVVNRFNMFREKSNPIQRLLRYIICSVKEYYYGSSEKNIDIVYSSSTPPTQGALSALVAKRLSKKYKKKVSFVYNLQDIFPDSLVNAKMTKRGSLIWKIGRKIEDFTYKNADKIIVISDGFKQNLMKKGVSEKKITVISNWVDLDKVKPVKRKDNTLFEELKVNKSKFVVVYAGNIGEAQGMDVIVDVAKKLVSIEEIQFVIFGCGSDFSRIKKRIEDERINNILITGLMPQERVSEVYSMGNVAIISCKPGTGNAGMPSKTWSIMACNTPIIASFDRNSDLAYEIKKAKAGYCLNPGDSVSIQKAIMSMYDKWKHGIRFEVNTREYALKKASKDICVKRYIETLLSTKQK